jgi:5'-nucleotidase
MGRGARMCRAAPSCVLAPHASVSDERHAYAGVAFAVLGADVGAAHAASRTCTSGDTLSFGQHPVGSSTGASVVVANCGDQAWSFTADGIHPATNPADVPYLVMGVRRARVSRRRHGASTASIRHMPAPTLAGKLVVAISSRALFDLTDSHRVYTELGVETYHRYQIEHEDELLEPGPAFALVTKLLRLNRLSKQYVEVILLSRNSADTGLRVFNAIKHYGLDITRAAFTKGEPTSRYVPAFGAHLFLSADTDDVRRALEDGYAAATIFPSVFRNETDELRIAFDGDAVLFSDEAERVYQSAGLAAFAESERDAAAKPLTGGPFKEFLAALHRIQADFPEDRSPIRTALVTARSAPAHERVIRTLRAWNIRIDEALFLGGLDKGEFLRAFGADIFFDDQTRHVESAAQHVPACHVPHGIANE